MADNSNSSLVLPGRRDFDTLWHALHHLEIEGFEVDFYGEGIGAGIQAVKEDYDAGASGGTKVKWAKVTAITDANNYTADIYDSRNDGTPSESSKQVRVWDIVDQLAVNDWIPVQASEVTGEDYECLQQLGALG